jgi:ABC-2 type transport system permease protein
MAYPLDKLPGGLQAIAKLLPAAALSDTVRSVLSTQPFPTGQLVVLLAWAVFAPLAAARWFRWEE